MPYIRNLAHKMVVIPKVLKKIDLAHMRFLLFGKSESRPLSETVLLDYSPLRASRNCTRRRFASVLTTEILVKS